MSGLSPHTRGSSSAAFPRRSDNSPAPGTRRAALGGTADSAAPSAAGPFVRRRLSLDDLSVWTKQLGAMSARDRSRLDGVSALRAPQMLAGALVAQAAMEAFDVPVLRICPWALREGLILRRFDTLRFEPPGDLPRGPAEGEEFLVPAGAGPSNNGKHS